MLAYRTDHEKNLLDISTGNKRLIDQRFVYPESWSPDGKELVYQRDNHVDGPFCIYTSSDGAIETIPPGTSHYAFMLHAGDKLIAGEKTGYTGNDYVLYILERKTGKLLKRIPTSGVRVWNVCNNGKLLVGHW